MPLDQPDPSPAPNDATVVPAFPRGMRTWVELADRPWRAPTLNGAATSFRPAALPSCGELLRVSDADALLRLRDKLLHR